jgi:streptomycin 6-kinase
MVVFCVYVVFFSMWASVDFKHLILQRSFDEANLLDERPKDPMEVATKENFRFKEQV